MKLLSLLLSLFVVTASLNGDKGGGISPTPSGLDIIAWVNDLIAGVRNWFTNQISSVYSFINGVIQGVKNLIPPAISDLWNRVVGWVNGQISAVTGTLNNIYSYVQGKITEVSAWVSGQIGTFIANLRADLTAVINNVQAFLLGKVNPLTVFLDWLKNTAPRLTVDAVTKILDVANRLYGSLIAFFKDPGGFILSLIWTTVLDFLQFVVAYALGAPGEGLPPIPAWYHPEGGAGGGGGGPILPALEGIVYPCEPLYVSGTTFSPNHPGTDFGIVDAQNIYAAHNGVVEEAGYVTYGFAFTITIRSDKYWSRYAHLKQILVFPGQVVAAGQLIAYGDSTGNSTGPHLHFEIKVNGAYRDPLTVL